MEFTINSKSDVEAFKVLLREGRFCGNSLENQSDKFSNVFPVSGKFFNLKLLKSESRLKFVWRLYPQFSTPSFPQQSKSRCREKTNTVFHATHIFFLKSTINFLCITLRKKRRKMIREHQIFSFDVFSWDERCKEGNRRDNKESGVKLRLI